MAGLVLVGLVGLVPLLVWSFLPTGESGEQVEFQVGEEPRAQVFQRLAASGLVDSPGMLRLYSAVLAPLLEFPPRSHLLRPGLTPRELLQRLGEAPRPATRVTFPEGFNRFSMGRRLEEQGICAARAFLQQSEDPQLLVELGLPFDSAEGYLFPSTYEFLLDESPRRVVARLAREGKRRLKEELARAGGLHPELATLGMGPHQVVILASVVEKETALASERGRIARVFLNRLADSSGGTRGRLQSDPTAHYGCLVLGEAASEACVREGAAPSPAMLRDSGNPYNTYRHAGLPPGPICSPGQDAVRAVLSAEATDELFFVADGTGRHRFSETFAEHKKAVEQLRKRRK